MPTQKTSKRRRRQQSLSPHPHPQQSLSDDDDRSTIPATDNAHQNPRSTTDDANNQIQTEVAMAVFPQPQQYLPTQPIKPFLAQVDHYLGATGIHPNRKSAALLTLLSPSALEQATKLQLTAETPYEQLKEEIKQLFSGTTTTLQHYDQFISRRQATNETTTQYAKELQRLAKDAFPDAPDEHINPSILQQFIRGLRNTHVQERLVRQAPVRIADAITLAAKCEQDQMTIRDLRGKNAAFASIQANEIATDEHSVHPHTRRTDPAHSEVQELKHNQLLMANAIESLTAAVTKLTNKNSHEVGTSVAQIHHPPQERAHNDRSLPSMSACFRCGLPGHWAKDCGQTLPNARRPNQPLPLYGRPPQNSPCVFCKKSNHPASECFFRTKAQDPQQYPSRHPQGYGNPAGPPRCTYCAKLGHIDYECRKRKYDTGNERPAGQGPNPSWRCNGQQ
jgi:hypothetical protein